MPACHTKGLSRYSHGFPTACSFQPLLLGAVTLETSCCHHVPEGSRQEDLSFFPNFVSNRQRGKHTCPRRRPRQGQGCLCVPEGKVLWDREQVAGLGAAARAPHWNKSPPPLGPPGSSFLGAVSKPKGRIIKKKRNDDTRPAWLSG